MRDRLDARSLLAYLGTTLLLVLVLQHPLQIAAVCSAVWLVVTGVLEPGEFRPFLLYGGIAALGVMVLNPIVSRVGTSLAWVGPSLPVLGRLSVSAEAIVFGVASGLRLLGVVGVFALVSTLLNPDALYRLASPLSPGSALVIALSIRLFPTSVRDAERIGDAMRSRGARLDSGRVAERVRARIPVVEALTMTSLDRAMDLAEALESRGYGRAHRSRMPLPKLATRDRAMLGVACAIGIAGVWFAHASAGYRYYPTPPARPMSSALACLPPWSRRLSFSSGGGRRGSRRDRTADVCLRRADLTSA